MPSIAITGAGGRLGSCFRLDPDWLERHELTAFSRFAEGESIRDCDDLFESDTISAFDILLHLAWSTVPRTAEEFPGQCDSVDLPLLEGLLKSAAAAANRREQPLHFVFFSTGAVYGNALQDSGSVESDPPEPVGAYARGKLAAEALIDRFAGAQGLRTTILRVSNAWGFPGNAGTPQGVIPHLIRASLDGSVFERWGEDSEKDYLHVDDLSRALLTVFEQGTAGLFNVAAGRSHRLSDLIAAVERVTGRPIQTKTGGGLSWDVSRNRISADRFSEATGWRPAVELEDGIARLIGEMGE